MNRIIVPLLLLLVLQGALTALVYWPETSLLDDNKSTVLLEFDPDLVDEIHIGDEYDNEIVLVRVGDAWLLPERRDLPANTEGIEKLLAVLAETRGLWPVADSVAARQRFQVAAYHYQRRLTLVGAGELLGTIYLGTSPGFRKVHARNEVDSAIFEIKLNAFDAPAIAGSWLDPRLLQVRTVMGIIADTYTLERDDGQWLANGALPADTREVDALLETLENLAVEGIAGEDMLRSLSVLPADLILEITDLAGKHRLEFYALEGGHYVYSEEYRLYFKLSVYDFDRLLSIEF